MTSDILTTKEACALLRVGRSTLYGMVRDLWVPAYRVGTGPNARLRFRRSDLEAWIARQTEPETHARSGKENT